MGYNVSIKFIILLYDTVMDVNGELVPVGGGDAIPLNRKILSVGRRSSCDIQLDFPNVSGKHCEFSFRNGFWYIRDLGSTNGIKINGERTMQSGLRPGDRITIAKRDYVINYNLTPAAEAALEALLSEDEDLLSESLMEKAGLQKRRSSIQEDNEDDD